MAVLHRLIHDRELQLYDGTRLMGGDKYEEAKINCGCSSDQEMASEKNIIKIHDDFRIVALAEPPTVSGSAKGQWLTTEMLSMFLFHEMRALSRLEEEHLLQSKTGQEPVDALKSILKLTYSLRTSTDNSLSNIANSLSTRQLVRIARRQQYFPNEDAYQLIQKACLSRFLPSLAREALEKLMHDIGIERLPNDQLDNVKCEVKDGALTIGNTTVPLYSPENKTKIPETLFYDTEQNLALLENMLQDYTLGEHLLLIGNQVFLFSLFIFSFNKTQESGY